MRDPSTIHIPELIEIGFHERASDVFIKADCVPMTRVHSIVKPLPGADWPMLTAKDTERMIREMMRAR